MVDQVVVTTPRISQRHVGSNATATRLTSARWPGVGILLLLPALLLLGLLYLYPTIEVIRQSFFVPVFSVTEVAATLSNVAHLTVLLRTGEMAVVVTVVSLVLAYPLAYFLTTVSPRTRAALVFVVVIPLWTSNLVRNYAWMVVLGRNGLVNKGLLALGIVQEPLPLMFNRFAAYVGMVHFVLPVMALSLYAVLARVDRSLIRVGEVLGGRPLRSFLTVLLPLSTPGVGTGCLLVFIISLGFFTTPILLGGPSDVTVAVTIERYINHQLKWRTAATLGLVLLGITLAVVVLFRRFAFGDVTARPFPGAITRGRPARLLGRLAAVVLRSMERAPLTRPALGYWDLRRTRGRRLLRMAAVAVLLFLLLPLAIVLPLSFSGADYLEFPPRALSLRWYRSYWYGPGWWTATINSFVVGLLSMTVSVICGTMAAFALWTYPGRLSRNLRPVLLSPLIMPTIIVAVGVYFVFARARLIGSIVALSFAHSALTLPLVVMQVSAALQVFDRRLEQAALSLGATPSRTFRRVVLPSVAPGIVSGALFAFLFSFDDLLVALFVSGSGAVTLPKRIWDSILIETDPTIAPVAALLILFSLLLVALSAAWGDPRRRRGTASKAWRLASMTALRRKPTVPPVATAPEIWHGPPEGPGG